MDFPFTVIQPEVDPTTGTWLMTSVWTPVGILFLYFGVSLVLLPTVMKGREPLEMAHFITVYNFLILLGNCLLAAYFFYYGLMGRYNPLCQPVEAKETSVKVQMASGTYFYLLSKIIELIDTFILNLRQRSTQKGFIHYYHHSSMIALVWLGLRYLPGGSTAILAFLNCFFHAMVYSYFYLVSSNFIQRGDRSFQMVIQACQIGQFLLAIAHCFTAFLLDCGYPRPASVLVILYITSFFLMFYWAHVVEFLKSWTFGNPGRPDQNPARAGTLPPVPFGSASSVSTAVTATPSSSAKVDARTGAGGTSPPPGIKRMSTVPSTSYMEVPEENIFPLHRSRARRREFSQSDLEMIQFALDDFVDVLSVSSARSTGIFNRQLEKEK